MGNTPRKETIFNPPARVGERAYFPDMDTYRKSMPKAWKIRMRSRKIMRRILRKVACKEAENLGDISTLADPSVVDTLIESRAAQDG